MNAASVVSPSPSGGASPSPSSAPPSASASASASVTPAPPALPASTPASAAPPLVVGADVDVESRTWAGINKPGGRARISKLHLDPSGVARQADVKYVLGGSEKGVELTYVKPHVELERGSRSRREDAKMNLGRLGGDQDDGKEGGRGGGGRRRAKRGGGGGGETKQGAASPKKGKAAGKKRKALASIDANGGKKARGSKKAKAEGAAGSSKAPSAAAAAVEVLDEAEAEEGGGERWIPVKDGKMVDYTSVLVEGRRVSYWWSTEDGWLPGTLSLPLARKVTKTCIKWTVRVDFDNGDRHVLSFHPREMKWKYGRMSPSRTDEPRPPPTAEEPTRKETGVVKAKKDAASKKMDPKKKASGPARAAAKGKLDKRRQDGNSAKAPAEARVQSGRKTPPEKGPIRPQPAPDKEGEPVEEVPGEMRAVGEPSRQRTDSRAVRATDEARENLRVEPQRMVDHSDSAFAASAVGESKESRQFKRNDTSLDGSTGQGTTEEEKKKNKRERKWKPSPDGLLVNLSGAKLRAWEDQGRKLPPENAEEEPATGNPPSQQTDSQHKSETRQILRAKPARKPDPASVAVALDESKKVRQQFKQNATASEGSSKQGVVGKKKEKRKKKKKKKKKESPVKGPCSKSSGIDRHVRSHVAAAQPEPKLALGAQLQSKTKEVSSKMHASPMAASLSSPGKGDGEAGDLVSYSSNSIRAVRAAHLRSPTPARRSTQSIGHSASLPVSTVRLPPLLPGPETDGATVTASAAAADDVIRSRESVAYSESLRRGGPSVAESAYRSGCDRAEEFVNNLVGGPSKSPADDVSEGSDDADGDLDVKLDQGRMDLFNDILHRITFLAGIDCMDIEEMIKKANSCLKSESRSFTFLEIRPFLQKLHDNHRIFLVEDEGKMGTVYAI